MKNKIKDEVNKVENDAVASGKAVEIAEEKLTVPIGEYFAMKNEIAALKSENCRLLEAVEDVSKECDKRLADAEREYYDDIRALEKSKVFLEIPEYEIKRLLVRSERIEAVERLYRNSGDRLCVADIMTVLGIKLNEEDE